MSRGERGQGREGDRDGARNSDGRGDRYETGEADGHPSRTARTGRRPVRAVLATLLLVVAVLLVPLSVLSTWAKLQIGDSDRYVAAMAPLADNPDVQDAVADAVTDTAMKELDAGPLEGAVDSFVRDAIKSFTGTDAFDTAWRAANRAAHSAVEQSLAQEGDCASGGCEVTIDLAPITEAVKKQLVADGVPLADQIPVEHVEVTVLEPGNLGTAAEAFRRLQSAGLWLPAATVVLTVAGLALAVRRRRALARTALGMALTSALLLIAISVGRRAAIDDLPSGISRPAAGAVYDALSSSPRTASWIILAVALVVAVAAWGTAFLRRARRPHVR